MTSGSIFTHLAEQSSLVPTTHRPANHSSTKSHQNKSNYKFPTFLCFCIANLLRYSKSEINWRRCFHPFFSLAWSPPASCCLRLAGSSSLQDESPGCPGMDTPENSNINMPSLIANFRPFLSFSFRSSFRPLSGVHPALRGIYFGFGLVNHKSLWSSGMLARCKPSNIKFER